MKSSPSWPLETTLLDLMGLGPPAMRGITCWRASGVRSFMTSGILPAVALSACSCMNSLASILLLPVLAAGAGLLFNVLFGRVCLLVRWLFGPMPRRAPRVLYVRYGGSI